MSSRKPTADELRHAEGKTIPDVIAPGLRILFCGINPGLYSGAVGHHFARPGNRFWPALHAAGLTLQQMSPFDDQQLLTLGYGITNVVERTTATAAELTPDELVEGGRRLAEKVRHYHPCILAILGISAYRAAFNAKNAVLGPQLERIGDTEIWVLPNPSGLNAHYRLEQLADWFRKVGLAADARCA